MEELELLVRSWSADARERLHTLVHGHLAAGLPPAAALMVALAELLDD